MGGEFQGQDLGVLDADWNTDQYSYRKNRATVAGSFVHLTGLHGSVKVRNEIANCSAHDTIWSSIFDYLCWR